MGWFPDTVDAIGNALRDVGQIAEDGARLAYDNAERFTTIDEMADMTQNYIDIARGPIDPLMAFASPVAYMSWGLAKGFYEVGWNFPSWYDVGQFVTQLAPGIELGLAMDANEGYWARSLLVGSAMTAAWVFTPGPSWGKGIAAKMAGQGTAYLWDSFSPWQNPTKDREDHYYRSGGDWWTWDKRWAEAGFQRDTRGAPGRTWDKIRWEMWDKYQKPRERGFRGNEERSEQDQYERDKIEAPTYEKPRPW